MFELHKVKELPRVDSWYPGDESECLKLFGWKIDKVLEKDYLDAFYVTYNDAIVSIMQMDEVGNLTYFTTSKISDINILAYFKFLKPKLDCYMKLIEYDLITEVAKDYRQGMFTLQQLGFVPFVEKRDRWIYGIEKKDS